MSNPITGPMKPAFLILTPACVMLGISTAVLSGTMPSAINIIIVLAGAVCAHISVNALNEYDDFKSGLDLVTVPTPFSGGSKALPENPEKAWYGLATGIISLVVTCAVGIYFVYIRGIMLLPLGILGVVIIVLYTKWITRSPFLCLMASGLGFGPLMVMGTHFALTGSYNWASFVVSLVPFFLVNDLLLLNQFPDAAADSTVGRKHLLIDSGPRKSARIYVIFLFVSFIPVVAGVAAGILPVTSLIELVFLILAIDISRGVLKNAEDLPALLPYMTKNVIMNIGAPVVLSAGILLSSIL
jgi:1,4-dihydroxy-2-naphthoate octaprenyltransferase